MKKLIQPIVSFTLILMISSCEKSPTVLDQKPILSDQSNTNNREYSIQSIRKLIHQSYPEETLLNPNKVNGKWSFNVVHRVLTSGETYSREQGSLKWSKITIPKNTSSGYIPVLLHRSNGETAFLLLEGSVEKFQANAIAIPIQ